MPDNNEEKTICTKEELTEAMSRHAEMAERIYRTAVRMEVTNTQEFINWQDRINACSYIREEDLAKIK